MTEKILITGGLGYLGGRVAKYLAQYTPYYLLLGTRKTDVETPTWLTNGKVVKLDVLSNDSLLSVCKSVTTVIHFAAINEIDSLENPELALRVNSLGTLRLLNVALDAGVKRIVYFSTAHVYGKLTGSISEKTIPRPTHPYAITHHVAEDFILAAHDSRQITGIVFRLSNGFGAPERPEVNRWTLIVNDLCKQAVTTEKLVLRSAGLQRRDFITLHDIARAVEHVLLLTDFECGDGLFNLGGENSMQIIELVKKISLQCKSLLGFEPKIIKPEATDGEKSDLFEYQIGKFKETGFQLSSNLEYEVNETLKMCSKTFL